jgi:hypothetical protein
MPDAPADIWYRVYETPDQLAALVDARTQFASASEFAGAFWSSVETEINHAHEIEAGFTTLQNYAAEVARWAAIEGGWRAQNAVGNIPFNTRIDYEALRDNAVIPGHRFGALWSLQIERNQLTHFRPEVDPRKIWAASARVTSVVPAFFLDVQSWAPTIGFAI